MPLCWKLVSWDLFALCKVVIFEKSEKRSTDNVLLEAESDPLSIYDGVVGNTIARPPSETVLDGGCLGAVCSTGEWTIVGLQLGPPLSLHRES
jgi:hypothetical protein